MTGTRIAVVGFGFSGLMLVANLVRRSRDCTIYIIAEDLNGLGLAYCTSNTAHLLNVPAGRMGAFPEAIEGFFAWLSTANGAMAKQRLKLTKDYAATDFVPRALYAAYLQDIWREVQENAAQHHCSIKLVEATATRICSEGELAVLTARGDAIAVDKIVLAIGNEMKPMAPPVKADRVIQNPWAKDAFTDAAKFASPVLLMGAGLTAVDCVLSLRSAGYTGAIVATSRHGKWPEVHAAATKEFTFDKDELFAQQRLQQLLRYVRSKMKQVGEWRVVLDALRPHTQALWHRLPARDQQRFLKRLWSAWNIPRHRMAPEVAAQLKDVRLVPLEYLDIGVAGAAINCTGGELQAPRSNNPLMKQMLADRVVEPHPNGVGLAVDPHYRAWGAAHPHLYVIGGWMTGQYLETTAVPELRAQAAEIAAELA